MTDARTGYRLSKYSLATIESIARNLNTTPQDVIAQAIALLKYAQGRKVSLKEKTRDHTVEIRNYIDKPVLKSL